jgi:signal transduction histidine kinase
MTAVTEATTAIDIQVQCEPRLGSIEGDPDLLRQAIENVIHNAAVAMEGSGRILLHASSSMSGVRLSIRDEGPGMSEDILLRATSPFFSTRATGTGLGLAIVQRVIDAHDGELSIESQEGVGTHVIINVPRHHSSEPASIVDTLSPSRSLEAPIAPPS